MHWNVSGRSAICEAYPETAFCSGTGLANCQFAFRGPKGELLLVETEGKKQATAGHDIGLDLGIKQSRPATPTERKQLLADEQDEASLPRLGSPEDPNRDDVNKIAFIMPPEWFLVPSMAVRDGDLMFRRYGLKIANFAGKTEFDPAAFKLATLDPIGTIINSQFLVCRRSSRESDTLTLHLPDDVGLRSFDAKSWQSKLEIRSLAGNRSRRVMGEYIRGDLFLDAAAMPVDDYLQLLTATRVIYEFGDKNDRLQFIIENQWGDAAIGDYLRGAVSQFFRIDPKAIGIFNTEGMLRACLAYKRTTEIPLPPDQMRR